MKNIHLVETLSGHKKGGKHGPKKEAIEIEFSNIKTYLPESTCFKNTLRILISAWEEFPF